jgi:hypothetical protein
MNDDTLEPFVRLRDQLDEDPDSADGYLFDPELDSFFDGVGPEERRLWENLYIRTTYEPPPSPTVRLTGRMRGWSL